VQLQLPESQSINQLFTWPISSGTTARSTGDSQWCPASSQEKTSWTDVSWGDDEMWSMILLMSRLPGSHSMSAGRRSEKLGYQQSTICW